MPPFSFSFPHLLFQLCGMVCRELVAHFFCLKPVKAAVRNSAITSHQAVLLTAGALKLLRKLNAQKL